MVKSRSIPHDWDHLGGVSYYGDGISNNDVFFFKKSQLSTSAPVIKWAGELAVGHCRALGNFVQQMATYKPCGLPSNIYI